MRILVVGSSGRMGKLYGAIVRYLKHDLLEYDPAVKSSVYPSPDQYDAAIVATPISDHGYYIKLIAQQDKPVLCEKPLAKDMDQVKGIVKYCSGRNSQTSMVNNWAFVGGYRDPMSERSIKINTYNTGNDGAWDFVQPLYLAESVEGFECIKAYPGLYVEISGKVYGRDDFDQSYIDMVQAFVDNDTAKLWPVQNMIEAHERVVEYGQG